MKKEIIGIPRAFYYYNHPKLWESFFTALDFEVIISKVSTKKTLNSVASLSESELCLPNKLFDGHVMSLIEQKVDMIFIPRVISLMKGHIACPRFGALPEATRASLNLDEIPNLKVITIDINESKKRLKKTLIELGQKLNRSKKDSKKAAITALESMAIAEQKMLDKNTNNTDSNKFLIMGHPYTINDAFIINPVLKKMREMETSTEILTFEKRNFKPDEILWCTFRKMNDRLKEFDCNKYSGIIQISTFNCGADSMMIEKFRRYCSKQKIPYLVLMMDEHTAVSGLETRLEAFIDSLKWNQKKEITNV